MKKNKKAKKTKEVVPAIKLAEPVPHMTKIDAEQELAAKIAYETALNNEFQDVAKKMTALIGTRKAILIIQDNEGLGISKGFNGFSAVELAKWYELIANRKTTDL